MIEKTWFEGYNDYKKCTATYDVDGKLKHFHTEIRDVELMETTNIYEILNNHLSQRQTKIVEVCFSGGLDSEVALLSCIYNKIPVRAITMRIYTGEVLINTHDVYYSEKFCREHHIEQKFVDLNIVKFYETGDYLDLLRPYNIKDSRAALHLWLLTQCSEFAILGGDYSWPWIIKNLVSPHQHAHNMYYQFMKDNGIHGIGNMLGYSLDSNLQFIKSHINVYDHSKHDPNDRFKLPYLKRDIYANLGFTNIEPRLKAYGLDMVPPRPYNDICTEMFGDIISSISWGDTVSVLIESTVRYNDKSS
jgi:hypothetical protein